MPLSFLTKKIPLTVQYIVFLAFITMYLLIKFTYHELWKDEWQAWLMARDMGWGELLGSLYYEGHPALWYLYLKVWSLFSTGANDELLLQLSHAVIMCGVYYVLCIRFELPFWLKALLLLSYYPFFEYGIVSRGYAFVMLIGYVIVLLLNNAKQHVGKLCVLFFLMCQTEVYAVMMAGALLFYLFLEQKIDKTWKEVLQDSDFRKIAGSSFAGLVVFLLSVYPRTSEDELSRAYLSEPFSGEIFFKGFQGMFANTFWIGSINDTNVFGVSAIGLILSLIVLIGLVYFFYQDGRDSFKEKNLLFTLLFFVVGYFIFLITIYTGGVRQWGTFFIFFTMLLQLYFSQKRKKESASRLDMLQIGFLVSVLLFQMYYSFLALKKEIEFPFSNAKIAAEFIQSKVPENVPIVAINKFEVAPVVGYANRNFYALPDGEPFTYFKWVEKVYLPPEQELKMFANFKKVGGIIIISPKLLGQNRYPNVKLWKEFTNYNIKNENYYLYTLEK